VLNRIFSVAYHVRLIADATTAACGLLLICKIEARGHAAESSYVVI